MALMSNHENTPGLTLGDSRRFIARDGEELSGFVVEVSGFGYVFASESGEHHNVPFANVIALEPEPQNPADQALPIAADEEIEEVADEVVSKEPEPVALDPIPATSVERIELHQPISLSQSIQPPAQDPAAQRAEIDAILIRSGFDPGIDYIRANYGDHWNVREIATEPEQTPEPSQKIDLTPVVDGFRSAISELMQAHSTQIAGLAQAVSALADKSAESESIQHALIAALNESRKPVEINMKLEMPEQRARRFVADRDDAGRMVLSEIPAATQKSLN